MTKFLLIRHGAHDLLGKVLAGRMPGIFLNEEGRQQAADLPHRLSSTPIDALHYSPMARAQETAQPLAQVVLSEFTLGLAFHEINFGAWTSQTFTELHSDPEWQVWNSQRSQARPPNGESILEVQTRFVRGLQSLAERWDRKTVAVVSHGDPIKSALLWALGAPLDNILNLEVSPASVSILRLHGDYREVTLVNSLGSVA